MTTSTPTYRHPTPPPNNIIDRKRHMKMYPATTAIKHSEEDKDLDDIDVLYEDTDLHKLCQCVILFIDNTFTHKSNVHISVYILIYKSVSKLLYNTIKYRVVCVVVNN